MWAAVTALTQEVRLQGRSFKQLSESLAPVAILAVQAIPVAWIAAIEILRDVQVFGDSSTVHEKDIEQTIAAAQQTFATV